MFKFFRKRLDRMIDKAVQKQVVAITKQIGKEAQIAIEQIKRDIASVVTKTTDTHLANHIGQLQDLTQNNLQMFKTQLTVLNAVHANFKGLVKILEPSVKTKSGDLLLEVEKRGFRYQVEMAFADLDKKLKDNTHPAIIEHLQSRIGQLYQQAQANGWGDIFRDATIQNARNWREYDHE